MSTNNIRLLGVKGTSKIDLTTRKFGVIYNVVDPKQVGILPNGTTVAWGWEFGIAWRYTRREAMAICDFIESCFDSSTPDGRERLMASGPVPVRYSVAEEAMLQAAALMSDTFKEIIRKRKQLQGMSLADRILAVNNVQQENKDTL